MNPWGIVLIIVGAVMIIVGFHGSQHNLIAAAKGQL